jgi:hypothetical protein
MRAAVPSPALIPTLVLVCALAGPAVAQPLPSGQSNLQGQMDLQLRLNALQAQQDMSERQSVIRETQTMALEARLRAEQAQAALRETAMTRPPSPAPQLDASRLVSIPDAALAASEARVRAAANNRR